MPSARHFAKRAFQCGLYEAQDVLAEIDDIELVCLQPRKGIGFHHRERLQRRLLYRDISKRLVFMNPGLDRVRLTRYYDLFVAVCQNYWDLLYINAIPGWKDRCQTSVCWLDELWVGDLPHARHWLHVLNQFDHVFIGCRGTVDAVSQVIGRHCHWLPAAVDMIRFTPSPNSPCRVVDVYSIGRRWEGIHQALLRRAEKKGMFYIHDTGAGADLEAFDHRQHRNLFASVAKRSRYFVVAPGKMDAPKERAGQIEVGYRYFEGAAAGAVMIGQAPDCPSFREMFDWPDAVIEVKPDGSDVIEILNEMDSQPGRLCEIWRRNSTQSLLRHDWMHRWKQVFDVAGISQPHGSAERGRRLRELASLNERVA
jgi:hypothetical protein